MSLIRQIWLLLLGSLLLAFVGSITVSVNSARGTMETQLRLKNSDNATALALVLSQQKGEPALMELLMAAQFDTGFYRQIRLLDSKGQVLFSREGVQSPSRAPTWFVALLPIESTPGVAQVSDGWRALGTVQVVSHTAFVHDDLWRGSLNAAGALAAVGLVAGLLALGVVRRIRRPLDQTVAQAHSLVNGEFVTVEEPGVPELQRLTQAMNTMVARLKLVFEAQAQQVESLRRQANCDPMTGLSNRKHFMGQLTATLQREDGTADGGLVLLRVVDLAGVNRQIGHKAADRMITAVSQALQAYTERATGCQLGRLNGSDFALCLPVGGVALETAQALCEALRVVLPAFGPGISVVAGAVELQRDRDIATVMSAADTALARAESRGAFAVELGDGSVASPALLGEEAWRQSIVSALACDRAKLVSFPVIDALQQLVHLECPLRLQLDREGPFDVAARWLPLAVRARLTASIDERAVALALAATARDNRPRCVNLSAASLSDSHFAARLRALLEDAVPQARLLSLEIPEVAAVEHFERMQELGRQLRPFGLKLGLEHAGERLSRLDRLFEAGLDYVKLDASVVVGVAGDTGRADFVRSVLVMLHGLSLKVYAEGVVDAADADALWLLGCDGMTGPWASAQRPDMLF